VINTGFDYCLDIVIANTRGRYDFPLILGRNFFTQGDLILDGEQGKLPSALQGYTRCSLWLTWKMMQVKHQNRNFSR